MPAGRCSRDQSRRQNRGVLCVPAHRHPRRAHSASAGFAESAAPGGGVRAGEHPVGRLTVPNERVPDDVHVVLLAELDEGVGRLEVIAIRAFPRMDELPLQVVFRRNLVELLFNERMSFFTTSFPRRPAAPVAMLRLMATPTKK